MGMARDRIKGENPAPVRLSALALGQCGRVCGIDDGNPFCRRLRDLGFVPGSRVQVRRTSPLRDPVEYEVRNTRICLRRSESRCIFVLLDGAGQDGSGSPVNGRGSSNGAAAKDRA